jgi:hypothetical protein
MTLRGDEIVGFWEQGCELSALDRSLLLLGAALPELGAPAHKTLSVAERDCALTALRCEVFGPRVQAQALCPNCNEELELEFDGSLGQENAIPREFVVQDGIRFRLPSSADLTAVAKMQDSDRACRELAQRCCLSDGVELSDQAISEADTRMGEIHAAATNSLRLNCALCGHIWDERFEIAPFLWIEIAERAVDLLDQVHWLASRYGWSEASILRMSAPRRTGYLERCCT